MTKNSNTLTLSIVIPVFNEEDYLGDCLASIAAQLDPPDEVIVVNNNSTDHSLDIARKFSFVKIIHEPRQHQSFAQKTGFDAATGDVIGRIDADSVLPIDWVRKIKQEFAKNSEIVAVAGGGWPYDVQLKQLAVWVFGFYNHLASLIAGNRVIWGSNCAFRRSTWQKISHMVLLRGDIWEDYDLSIKLAAYGKIHYKPDIVVGASFRAAHKPFLNQVEYQLRSVRTFYLNRGFFRAAILCLVWNTMVVFYPLALLDNKALKPLSLLKTRRRQVLESTALVD